MASVFVPVAYVLIVFGSLYIFSRIYRKRLSAQKFEPYFPAHVERNTYITLLARDPPTPDPVLKAALVRRAVADVNRALKIREDKPSLQNLLQKGAIGDDLWNSFLAAEKELEVEIVEVMREAESFLPQWGQLIFQTANEVIASDKMRSTLEGMQAHTASLEAKYGVPARIRISVGPPPPGAKPMGQVSAPGTPGPQPPTPLGSA
ncbi:translocation protein sec66 [Cylindrobasidium torrendii FP15055 ss-10]|uniref:Translocation protein sec66 n=1 Tax=Cylindrobasidium torrendii FP15055 ss-10 TaxID=1314674 RepID=A0A0D7BIV1_9AGAR|nr:translocation protein sec66 [Cylindrobasidium torrendii FP15055 ss-10]